MGVLEQPKEERGETLEETKTDGGLFACGKTHIPSEDSETWDEVMTLGTQFDHILI